jgi:predicted DNA-binding protein (UPF0251 family)/predicted Fe-Mo cluster-binding NifX family protein
MVDAPPDVTYFKPRGVPLRDINEVYLSIEGFEALRLVDYEGLKQEEAAQQMHVSRQTLGRILSEARKTVSQAVVCGLALRIQGGDYRLARDDNALSRSSTHATRAGQDVRMHDQPINGKRENDNSRFSTKEATVEKIAISSEGPDLDGPVDPRFGRAAGFMIVNPQTFEFEYIDNGASQARAQGAGINAAEIVSATGAQVLLTGYVGPKAFQALEAAGIKVGQNLADMTVRQAVERFTGGQVDWAQAPNSGGHGR